MLWFERPMRRSQVTSTPDVKSAFSSSGSERTGSGNQPNGPSASGDGAGTPLADAATWTTAGLSGSRRTTGPAGVRDCDAINLARSAGRSTSLHVRSLIRIPVSRSIAILTLSSPRLLSPRSKNSQFMSSAENPGHSRRIRRKTASATSSSGLPSPGRSPDPVMETEASADTVGAGRR